MNSRYVISLLALATFFLSACGPDFEDQGLASYYSDKLQGRPTASGEPYDRTAFTAAHPSIPFGTMIEVTNLDNGKSVVVEVNDRGPTHEDRVVDLSRVAAREIGLVKSGVAPVEIAIAD